MTSRDICKRLPINKEKGYLFAIPLKNIKVKIKIQEAMIFLKTIRVSSSNQSLSI
jgi:hypothetical protein